MSGNIYVVGVRNVDGKLKDMAELATKCKDLGVSLPREVEAYFKGTDALACDYIAEIIRQAREVSLTELNVKGLVRGSIEDGGLAIDLRKIPADMLYLRVCEAG